MGFVWYQWVILLLLVLLIGVFVGLRVACRNRPEPRGFDVIDKRDQK